MGQVGAQGLEFAFKDVGGFGGLGAVLDLGFIYAGAIITFVESYPTTVVGGDTEGFYGGYAPTPPFGIFTDFLE